MVAGTRGVKVTLTETAATYSHQDGVGDKVKGVAVTIPAGQTKYYDVSGNEVTLVFSNFYKYNLHFVFLFVVFNFYAQKKRIKYKISKKKNKKIK